MLDARYQILEGDRGKISFQQVVGKTRRITAGEVFGRLGKSGKVRVVPNWDELSTKLSTLFSPRLAENYPTIHRLYYYYNLY